MPDHLKRHLDELKRQLIVARRESIQIRESRAPESEKLAAEQRLASLESQEHKLWLTIVDVAKSERALAQTDQQLDTLRAQILAEKKFKRGAPPPPLLPKLIADRKKLLQTRNK